MKTLYESASPAVRRWVDEMLRDVPEGRHGCGHCARTFASQEEIDAHARRDHGFNIGGDSVPRVGIDQETYRFWRANAGNAKARRRWRRRDIPNSQREAARQIDESDPSEAREREDL